MKPLRVLVCGSVLSQGIGGVRRHNAEILPRAARILERHGGALTVLAGRAGIAFELPRSIAVLPSDVPPRPVLARAWRESAALEACLRSARSQGSPFDVVHTAHLPAPRGLSAPFTLLLHDLKSVLAGDASSLRRAVGRRVLRDAAERAASIACVSRTLATELERYAPNAAGRVGVVPNGCDHLQLVPRVPAAAGFLLCVGRIEPRKNVELLVRALALAPDLPEVHLAGDAQREHLERILALARELGVDGRIRVLGVCDDARLAQSYGSCACVVLPSLREGFDIPLAEALRAGAPIAASDLDVHREVVAGRAELFDPRSPQDCVRAIRAALAAAARAADPAGPRPLGATTWDEAALALVALWRSAASVPST